MTEVAKRPFNHRAFWSLLAAVTVIGLPWTGIENHLHQFEGMTMARHGWMAAHNILATLFVVSVVAHLVLNFRALARHARGAAGRLLPPSREALLALGIAAGLLLLFVGHTRLAAEGGAGPGHHATRSVEGHDGDR